MTTPMERAGELYGDDQVQVEPEVDDDGEMILDPAESIGTGRANWHLRKALALRAEQTRIIDLWSDEIAELMARRDAALKRLTSSEKWHVGSIEAWHRHERRAGRAESTIVLPAGTSKLTSPKAKIEVSDEEAFRDWLQKLGPNEDGESWDRVVYARQPDKFLSSKIPRGKLSTKGERGPTIPVPDKDGNRIPGLRGVVGEDSHSAS